MMSLSCIRAMSADAAREAARSKREPYVIYDRDEIDRMTAFPFPFVGSYVPKGWKLVDTWFCDSSGMGADYEPALSIRQLKAKLIAHAESAKQFGYALTEAGQFQIRLGIFERTPKARATRPRRSRVPGLAIVRNRPAAPAASPSSAAEPVHVE
jgi:hypothetical protein